jgi:hypothetical protein
MTETITIRLRRPKRELLAKAKPNVNAWVNDLIDHALGAADADWDTHFERRRRHKPVRYGEGDELRRLSR